MMKKRDEIHLWQRFKNLHEQHDGSPHFLGVSEELDIPYKRAGYLAHKWSREGLVEWGIAWRACWITPLGEHADIGLYGFEYDVDPEEYTHGY